MFLHYLCTRKGMNDKSDNSLKAADQLIKTFFYTESVHCSYYAVLQLAKFKLANAKRRPLSYIQQEEKAKSSGSHNYILQEIRNRLQVSVKEEKAFSEEFLRLKSFRVDADYSTRQFNLDGSCQCKDIADRLIYKLKRYSI